MPESNRIALRQLLLSRFDELRSRLSRRFGSSERADEALQETYLRLEQGSEIGPVRNPSAYLLRMAINTATTLLVAQSPDDTPGPMRVVESRLEVEALKRALEDLPERRRAIFLASWVEELPHREIAERYGVSVRTVQVELKRALEHCAARLGKRLERK